MKSIKEKTEEYIAGFHPSIQRMCSESYIDGANYVLDAIGNILSHPTHYVNADKSVEEGMLEAIIECIAQLQK